MQVPVAVLKLDFGEPTVSGVWDVQELGEHLEPHGHWEHMLFEVNSVYGDK